MEDVMDKQLCGRCHEHDRHGRAPICIHCLRDNAARSVETKARLGISSPLQMMRGPRPRVLRDVPRLPSARAAVAS